MRFLMVHRIDETKPDAYTPGPEVLAGVGKLMEEAARAGVRVRVTRGKPIVIDGPFAEAKEVIGGFAMVEVGSKEEAHEVAQRFMELHRVHWPSFDCECEVRPVEEYVAGRGYELQLGAGLSRPVLLVLRTSLTTDAGGPLRRGPPATRSRWSAAAVAWAAVM